jgi:hypothetical protein
MRKCMIRGHGTDDHAQRAVKEMPKPPVFSSRIQLLGVVSRSSSSSGQNGETGQILSSMGA